MAAYSSRALTDERRALLGLWSIPGIGAQSIEIIQLAIPDLASLLDEPVARWSAGLDLLVPALSGLSQVERLRPLSDAVAERCERAQIGIAFRGDPAYPARLAETSGSPPLLFFRGPPCTARPRVAMVGSRKVPRRREELAMEFAEKVACQGVGIVSGAADGIDTACHLGALNTRQETWAFLGSGLDNMDCGPRALQEKMLPRGGTVYSEFPPWVSACRATFPRRNRLISGSSDVVLVLRAKEGSGARHTVKYAIEQGRPVLAIPGEETDETAKGGNRFIRDGQARICVEPADVFRALKLDDRATAAAPLVAVAPVAWDAVSADARAAFVAVGREPTTFEEVLAVTRLRSGALASALCELELLGLVVQRPGKRYEKV